MEDKVLAVVNGKEITERDLYYTITRFPAERQQYYNTEQGRKEFLEQMIAFELIHKYALDEKIDNDEAYKYQLEMAKKELLTQYAVNKVLAQASATEEEAKLFYDMNTEMFRAEESIRASHILVDNFEEADKIVGEVRRGKDFAEAAAEYSSCPSKQAGGDLGYFTKGRMVPEFEKAAFELREGEISEPVQTQFGYHIIRLVDRKSSEIPPFEAVKDSIINDISTEKQNQAYTELINSLRSKYEVEYK